MTIKIPRTYMGRPIEGAIERVLAENPPTDPEPLSSGVNVSNLTDAWKISGVEYRNGIHTVELAKSLLDNGNVKTQSDWVVHYESAKGAGDFHTPDYPIFYGIVKALYTARDDSVKSREVEEAQKFLKETSRAKWLMTLTRILYHTRGLDEVIHNSGTRDQYLEKTDFVGPAGDIRSNPTPQAYKALLGTDNIQEISDVFQWLNGTPTYIYRVNQRPENTIVEKVAWFYADSGGAGLYCYWIPSGSSSSLGVRVCAEGAAQK